MFERILIPVAPGHEEDYGHALEVAKTLLKKGGKISLLSVIEAIPIYVETYLPADYLETNVDEVKAAVEKAFASEDVEINVVPGHSAGTILEWARTHDNDCITIMSHRPGFSDLFIGSTASKVVRQAQCAVVVLR